MLPAPSVRHLPLLLVPLSGLAYLAATANAPARAAVPPAGLLNRPILNFIRNDGQLRGAAQYYVRGKDRSVYFTPSGVTYALLTHDGDAGSPRVTGAVRPDLSARFRRYALKLDFVGANAGAELEGTVPGKGVVHYLTGARERQRTGVSTYGGLHYEELWKGVDLAYRGVENGMKYEFQLEPGADPRQVRLAYRGASEVRVNDAGQLVAETPSGTVTDDAPIAYQEIQGKRVNVAARYELLKTAAGRVEYGFQLGDYDRSQALVIDPAVLIYCGYLGGAERDLGAGIAVDADGSAYVAGYTYSTEETFPEEAGFDATYNGQGDAFVAKVLPDGSGFAYCTYLGGADNDTATGISVDSAGRACVGGVTHSTQSSFPVVVGPDLTYNGEGDGWVARLSADGAGLDFCGYVGGAARDAVYGVAEADGRVSLTGDTESNEGTFPLVNGPSTIFGGMADAFVAQVTEDGSNYVFSGYIGGADVDSGNAVDVGEDGVVHVAGNVLSKHDTLPGLVGPDLTHNGGESDAFIARVKPNGTLSLFTYLGGIGWDSALAVAVDPAGATYVAGLTDSDERTFPTIIGPVLTHANRPQPRRRPRGPLPPVASAYDGFVAKLPLHAASFDYAGFVGGTGVDAVLGLAVDKEGFAYIAGHTQSTQRSFPETVGPDLKYGGGFTDGFVARVHSDGSRFNYCGYLGGAGTDAASGVAVDPTGAAYVSGFSSSAPNTLPVRNGPTTVFNGGAASTFSDGLVVKVSPFTDPFPQPGRLVVRPTRLRFGKVRVGKSKSLRLRLYNQGRGPLTVNLPTLRAPYTLEQTGDVTLLPNQRRNIDVTFAPTTTGRFNNGIAITSNDPRAPLVQTSLQGRGR